MRWHRLRPTALLLAAAGLALLLAPGDALGSFTAKVTNSNDTAASAVVGSGTCTATASASAKQPFFVWPFAETAVTGALGAAADVSGNNRTGSYQGLLTGGVTFAQAGPCPRDTPASRSITLDGSSGFVSQPVAASPTAPNTFSEQVWFRTSTAGGRLIGLGSAATGSSGSYDRHIYLNSTGNLVFGVYPAPANVTKTVQSPLTYNDNKWHQVVATLAPSGANVGIRLYVDGNLVASDATVVAGQSFGTGYWRVGYDNLNSWPGAATPYYFKGSLAYAAVWNTALSPSDILTMFDAGIA